MRLSSAIVALVATGTLTLLACTADAPPDASGTSNLSNAPGPKGATSSSQTGGAAPSASSAPSPVGSAQAKAPGIGPCATKASADECVVCCAQTSPDTQAAAAADHALSLKWQQCACAASRCGDVCKTDFCAAGFDPDNDAQDGSACAQCLDDSKTDDCDTLTDADETQLESTAGYQAWDKCRTDAKCDDLPGGGDDDDDDDDAGSP